jgi:hypothetical protein
MGTDHGAKVVLWVKGVPPDVEITSGNPTPARGLLAYQAAGINARVIRSPLLAARQGHENEVFGCCGQMAILNCAFSTR